MTEAVYGAVQDRMMMLVLKIQSFDINIAYIFFQFIFPPPNSNGTICGIRYEQRGVAEWISLDTVTGMFSLTRTVMSMKVPYGASAYTSPPSTDYQTRFRLPVRMGV
jgi:hypothetical protein